MSATDDFQQFVDQVGDAITEKIEATAVLQQ